MKKGFTIVEIIISISLILIVGVSTTFFIFNNKKNNKLETITREILEAANLYINKEVDEDGTVYKNGILKGAKGLQLSVKNLVDKGYIDEKYASTLESSLDKDRSELYVLAALSLYEDSEDICGEGIINFTPKWDINSDEPIYLCGKNNTIDDDNYVNDGLYYGDSMCYRIYNNNELGEWKLTDENNDFSLVPFLIENYNGVLEIEKPSPSINTYNIYDKKYGFYYKYIDDKHVSTTTSLSNGFFYIEAIDNFIYRGMVSNNYIKMEGELFRIVSANDFGLKLISDKAITEDEVEVILEESKKNKLITDNSKISEQLTNEELFFAGIPRQTLCYCENYDTLESYFCGSYLLDDSNYCWEWPTLLNNYVSVELNQRWGTKFTGKGTKDDPYVFSELTPDDIEEYCKSYEDKIY